MVETPVGLAWCFMLLNATRSIPIDLQYYTCFYNLCQYIFIVLCNLLICKTLFCDLYIHKKVFLCYTTDMNEQILQEAGLTNSEARAYAILVENSPCSPPKLADLADESRTNTYKLLESLEVKGLVTRDDTQKKLRYWANSPSVLLDVVKKRRSEAEAIERRLQGTLPSLINEYIKYTEQPTVRFYNGKSGIKRVYDEQLQDNNKIIYIRNRADIDFFGFDFMSEIRKATAEAKIPRTSLSPITPDVPSNWREHERAINQKRIWLASDTYTAPVEWSVFGDKVALISYGSEAVSAIIESSQAAEGMRQILTLLADKLPKDPDYREP